MALSLRPMTPARLRDWIAAGQQEYLDDLVRSGESGDRAREKARRSYADLFPDGVPAPGHVVSEVVRDGEPVGSVWIGPQANGADSLAWWLWDIAIDVGQRGRGYGRAAMLLAEAQARRRGARSLGLNVFGFNAAARGLYESLGYQVQAIQMRKTFD